MSGAFISSAALVRALRMISTVTGSTVTGGAMTVDAMSGLTFDFEVRDDERAVFVDGDRESRRDDGGGGGLDDDRGAGEGVPGQQRVALGDDGVELAAVEDDLADLVGELRGRGAVDHERAGAFELADDPRSQGHDLRSEEHTSELQSLMRISYAVFCLKKK